MNLVVSDSGPVHYLVLCEAIDVIHRLYGQLVMPAAVAQELSHPRAPLDVQTWMNARPKWAAVAVARQIEPFQQLGPGEREAISLALEINATQLLVDDLAARRIAVQRGLRIAGTVGILEAAAERGLLELPGALQKLLSTNFRVDAQVIRHALERDLARRRTGSPRPVE